MGKYSVKGDFSYFDFAWRHTWADNLEDHRDFDMTPSEIDGELEEIQGRGDALCNGTPYNSEWLADRAEQNKLQRTKPVRRPAPVKIDRRKFNKGRPKKVPLTLEEETRVSAQRRNRDYWEKEKWAQQVSECSLRGWGYPPKP